MTNPCPTCVSFTEAGRCRKCGRDFFIQPVQPAEPREWFIELRNRPNHRSCVRGPATVNADGTLKTVRVVEGSAYDALAAERDLLAKKFANADMLLGEHSAHVDKQEREIEKLKAERDELAKTVAFQGEARCEVQRQYNAIADERDTLRAQLGEARERADRAKRIAKLQMRAKWKAREERDRYKAELEWIEKGPEIPLTDEMRYEKNRAIFVAEFSQRVARKALEGK